MDIECAGGSQLPYSGYIEVNINTPGRTNNFNTYLVLVVPDSNYNQHIPLLIGTNVLNTILQDLHQLHGDKYLQNADLTTPWYLILRCIALHEKELKKNKNRLALVKNVELNKITIPPNTVMEIQGGYFDKETQYHNTSAIHYASDVAFEPIDLDVEPRLHQFNFKNNGHITIQLPNVTTRTITIPPKAVVCELQPVTIQPKPSQENQPVETSFLDREEINKNDFSDEELKRGKYFILDYSDIFSNSYTDVGYTNIVQHRIGLLEDKTFKQRYRRIPPSMYDEGKVYLQQLLDMNIIWPSHSPWASNVALVKKKDNSLRMCVDYRMLNKNSKKDSYALQCIAELLDCLSGNYFFS